MKSPNGKVIIWEIPTRFSHKHKKKFLAELTCTEYMYLGFFVPLRSFLLVSFLVTRTKSLILSPASGNPILNHTVGGEDLKNLTILIEYSYGSASCKASSLTCQVSSSALEDDHGKPTHKHAKYRYKLRALAYDETRPSLFCPVKSNEIRSDQIIKPIRLKQDEE